MNIEAKWAFGWGNLFTPVPEIVPILDAKSVDDILENSGPVSRMTVFDDFPPTQRSLAGT